MKLISCITPTYNRAALLKDSIESTISQTYPNWEMIIVDDGSTDNTKCLVKSYIDKDNRIKYYKNSGKGGASARNFGISKANGDYIAFLDDDDISLPHRFKSQLNAAERNGSRFIVSGYEVRDKKTDKLKSVVRLELKGSGAGFPSRWLIKRDLLLQVNGFDEDYPSMQDIELSYRLAEHEIFALQDEIVSIIYPTSNSVSTRMENSLAGKELLMQKLGHKMKPLEAAAWYYTIAIGNFALNRPERAKEYFKKAMIGNRNLSVRAGYLIFCFVRFFDEKYRRIAFKILNKTRFLSSTVVVKHKVVK
jgi:glycosyltransferase involved in cell wall biosynthesis